MNPIGLPAAASLAIRKLREKGEGEGEGGRKEEGGGERHTINKTRESIDSYLGRAMQVPD